MAIGGAYSQTDGAPFPAGGIVPILKPFYDYSWVVGLAVAFLLGLGVFMLIGGPDLHAAP